MSVGGLIVPVGGLAVRMPIWMTQWILMRSMPLCVWPVDTNKFQTLVIGVQSTG